MKRLTDEQVQAGLEFLNLQITPNISQDLYICLTQLETLLENERAQRSLKKRVIRSTRNFPLW